MSEGEWKILQKFSTKPVLIFDCAVNVLPGCNVPLIACAGDDGGILLFNFQSVDGRLDCIRSLRVPGHEDWVRALAFTIEGSFYLPNLSLVKKLI